jgi:hypothetical protein
MPGEFDYMKSCPQIHSPINRIAFAHLSTLVVFGVILQPFAMLDKPMGLTQFSAFGAQVRLLSAALHALNLE